MDCWDEGGVWVQHERDTGREKLYFFAFALHALRPPAKDRAEIHPRLFENSTLGHNARAPTAAAFALPIVFSELCCAIDFLQCRRNVVLEMPHVCFDASTEMVFRHRR